MPPECLPARLRYLTQTMAARAELSIDSNGDEDVCCRFQTVRRQPLRISVLRLPRNQKTTAFLARTRMEARPASARTSKPHGFEGRAQREDVQRVFLDLYGTGSSALKRADTIRYTGDM